MDNGQGRWGGSGRRRAQRGRCRRRLRGQRNVADNYYLERGCGVINVIVAPPPPPWMQIVQVPQLAPPEPDISQARAVTAQPPPVTTPPPQDTPPIAA